jgi:hypothetical protein
VGDAFFLNELLDLEEPSVKTTRAEGGQGRCTSSSVLAARSETNGRAIAGMRWLAERWPFCELTRRSDMFAVFPSLTAAVYRRSRRIYAEGMAATEATLYGSVGKAS